MIANNVQIQETVTTVHFLDVNADRLKGAIIEECSVWQQKIIGVLYRQTLNMVNHVYHYIAENSKKWVLHIKYIMNWSKFFEIKNENTDLQIIG